jgi:GcrA cell cycle regulator
MDAELKILWCTGMRALLIGQKMGKTKNAVIGRAHRIGCPSRKNNNKECAMNHVIRRREKKHLTPHGQEPNVQAISKAMPEKITQVEREDGAVRFMDLKPHHCRAPMWDHGKTGDTYCGKRKKFGSSYCEDHHRIFTQKVPSRKVRYDVERVTMSETT